jgi:ABC-type Co2+ transport system permease subunit
VTSNQAQRYVLISVFGLLIVAAYRGKLSDNKESFSKRLWGTGVLAIMLGLVADVAPQIAGPFAALILLGSLTTGGDKALNNFLGKASSGKPVKQPTQPSHPGTNP